MTLTNLQMARRYMATEVVSIQRLLDQHDISESRALRMLQAAVEEAWKFFPDQEACDIQVSLIRGKITVTIS